MKEVCKDLGKLRWLGSCIAYDLTPVKYPGPLESTLSNACDITDNQVLASLGNDLVLNLGPFGEQAMGNTGGEECIGGQLLQTLQD